MHSAGWCEVVVSAVRDPWGSESPEDLPGLPSGGGFCVNNQDEFESVVQGLIRDDAYFTKTSLAATDVIHKNLGSSTRIIRSLIRD